MTLFFRIKAASAAAAVFLFSTTLPTQVAAQERWYGNFLFSPEFPTVLFLNGPIQAGAIANFRKALREHDSTILVLNSPGGSVSEGLEISAIVNDRGIETLIPDTADCASACSFIFFAGNPRTVRGRLGVHQFASTTDRTESLNVTETVTQDIAAKIIDYLNEFDTPSKVFVRMYETPPQEMYWFSRREIEKEGIEISPRTSTPSQDSPPTIAARPSFNCAKAASAVEKAICSDNSLAALDVQLARTYQSLKKSLPSSQFARVRSSQREWIAQRDYCGSSVSCISQAYRNRLNQLN